MSVVAILGASDNPSRYSFMAMELLREKGHEVRLVNPRLKAIGGVALCGQFGPTFWGRHFDDIC